MIEAKITGCNSEKGFTVLPDLSERSSPANFLWTRKFILLIAANTGVTISFYMLIAALPSYTKAITGKDTLTGLATGIFLLASVLFRPFAGRSVDTMGRKVIFLFGLAVFFVSALAIHWVPTLLMLVFARFVQGFGWAYCNTAAGAIASDIIPKPRLAEGIGYYALCMSIAMGISPALALFLIQRYNFQYIFYVCAGFVLLSIILAMFMKHHNVDKSSDESPVKVKAVFLEKKALRPALVMFFLVFNYAAIISFLPLFGQFRQVADVGLFFTVFAISITIARPLSGRLADRKRYDIVIVPGLILCSITLLILYLAHSLPVFLIAGLIYGIGFGAVVPTSQAMAVLYVLPEQRGAATATYFMLIDLGLGISSVMWGIVAQAVGYDVMFLFVIIPTLLSLLVYLFLPTILRSSKDN